MVAEHPEVRDLRREPVRNARIIRVRNTDENAQSPPNRTDDLSSDRDARLAHPLDQCAHPVTVRWTFVATTLEEARKRLDDEYGQVRRHLGKIHEALDRVEKAGPEDDLHGLLKNLEDAVKEVRDGGLVGSGANGHRRALEEYRKLKDGK